MADDPNPGGGDVTFDLAGESVTLKCSPNAALTLSRQPGSFFGAGNDPGVAARILACDLDMMCLVVRAGLGLTGNAVPDLPKQVYAAGLFNIRGSLSVFVGALANGGVPLSQGGDATGAENPQTA